MKYIKEYKSYFNDNFKEWFKNSKIINKDGSPMIVYHGTKRDFDEFQTKDHRKDTEGYYFTNDPEYAYVFMGYDKDKEDFYIGTKDYLKNPTHGETNPNIIPVYLSVKNPLILKEDDVDIIEDIGYWKDIYDRVKSKGYDGVIMDDMSQIFVFDPTQIKSAYGNIGSFNPSSKSITD